MAKKKVSKSLKQKFDNAYTAMRSKDAESNKKKGCDCGGCGK